jgi:hypothetical protein
MLKRLTAILFIFIMAGQISVGVCGCLGGDSRPPHSCCEHKKPYNDMMRRKGCCDDNDCAMRQSERLPQDRTNATAKITLKVAVEPTMPKLESFEPVTLRSFVLSTAAVDHRLKYSRPPDLYLRHHAFLI